MLSGVVSHPAHLDGGLPLAYTGSGRRPGLSIILNGPGMQQERSNPREIEGKQALFVVNLEPRKMMGEVSEGMLFDIGYADGITPVLAIPETPVPNGSRAG